MSNITIFTSGTNFMNTGSPLGPLIALKRFIPIYDWRLDPTVLPQSSLLHVSAADPISAVDTYGEKIYNIDSLSLSVYSISNPEVLLYNSNQTGTTTIANSPFNALGNVTLLNGVPLSHIVSGSSLVYNSPDWTVTSPVTVSGNNDVPTGYLSPLDKYFDSISFAPISSAAGGVARGVFTVRLNNQKGNFKFNKIAIYAVKMTAGGIEDTSVEPVLFAVGVLNQPIIKANDGSNINYFEADIELQFSSNGYYSQVSFLDNNAWRYVAGESSVFFLGRAALGTSAIPGSYTAHAKLEIVEPNISIPMTRFSDGLTNSYIEEFYLSDEFSSNESKKISSLPTVYHTFKTSGDTDYNKISLGADSFTLKNYLTFLDVNSVSGIHSSSFEHRFYGNFQVLDIKMNSTSKQRFYGYDSVVLGSDAANGYSSRKHFLTVHGGELIVGQNLANTSPLLTLSGDVSSFTYPVLSANGYIRCKGLEVSTGTSYLNYASITYELSTVGAITVLGKTLFTLSADFIPLAKFIGGVSALGDSIFEDITTNNIVQTGSGGSIGLEGYLIVVGSSTFGGPCLFLSPITGLSASFSNAISVGTNLSAVGRVHAQSDIRTNTKFYELSRAEAIGYWTAYTPSLTAFAGSVSVITSSYGYYTLIGKTLIVQFSVDFEMNGSATNTGVYISLPNSYVPDVTMNFYPYAKGQYLNYSVDLIAVLGISRFGVYITSTAVYTPQNTGLQFSGTIIIPIS